MQPKIVQEEILQSDDGDERISVNVPLLTKYESIMTRLFGDDMNLKPVVKLRESLFGPDMPPVIFPDSYQELGIIKEMGYDLATYKRLDIHERAQLIAYHRLNSMMETYRRYMEIIAENNKKALEKANKKK